MVKRFYQLITLLMVFPAKGTYSADGSSKSWIDDIDRDSAQLVAQTTFSTIINAAEMLSFTIAAKRRHVSIQEQVIPPHKYLSFQDIIGDLEGAVIRISTAGMDEGNFLDRAVLAAEALIRLALACEKKGYSNQVLRAVLSYYRGVKSEFKRLFDNIKGGITPERGAAIIASMPAVVAYVPGFSGAAFRDASSVLLEVFREEDLLYYYERRSGNGASLAEHALNFMVNLNLLARQIIESVERKKRLEQEEIRRELRQYRRKRGKQSKLRSGKKNRPRKGSKKRRYKK